MLNLLFAGTATSGARVFAATLFMIWGAAVARLMRDHEGDGAWLYLAFLSASTAGWAVNIVASFIWMVLSARGWAVRWLRCCLAFLSFPCAERNGPSC